MALHIPYRDDDTKRLEVVGANLVHKPLVGVGTTEENPQPKRTTVQVSETSRERAYCDSLCIGITFSHSCRSNVVGSASHGKERNLRSRILVGVCVVHHSGLDVIRRGIAVA